MGKRIELTVWIDVEDGDDPGSWPVAEAFGDGVTGWTWQEVDEEESQCMCELCQEDGECECLQCLGI